MDNYPFQRQIHSPVTAEQLRPLDRRCERVQFAEPLKQKDHEKLADFLLKYPNMTLRVYGHYFKKINLDFLKYYPNLRSVYIDVFELKNIDGLKYLSPDLEGFAMGQTRSRAHSLLFLRRFPQLKTLFLEGHQKHIGVVGELMALRVLQLRSITLPDLSSFLPLKKLQHFSLKLGGTKDVGLLPQIGKLREIDLWMIRGLTDLTCLSHVLTLQYLALATLKHVTQLPSFSPLKKLRRVDIEQMPGLTDLRPVSQAAGLEDLIVNRMPQLEPEAFRPFLKHPTLSRLNVHIGNNDKNQAVKQLLQLPPITNPLSFRFRA